MGFDLYAAGSFNKAKIVAKMKKNIAIIRVKMVKGIFSIFIPPLFYYMSEYFLIQGK